MLQHDSRCLNNGQFINKKERHLNNHLSSSRSLPSPQRSRQFNQNLNYYKELKCNVMAKQISTDVAIRVLLNALSGPKENSTIACAILALYNNNLHVLCKSPKFRRHYANLSQKN